MQGANQKKKKLSVCIFFPTQGTFLSLPLGSNQNRKKTFSLAHERASLPPAAVGAPPQIRRYLRPAAGSGPSPLFRSDGSAPLLELHTSKPTAAGLQIRRRPLLMAQLEHRSAALPPAENPTTQAEVDPSRPTDRPPPDLTTSTPIPFTHGRPFAELPPRAAADARSAPGRDLALPPFPLASLPNGSDPTRLMQQPFQTRFAKTDPLCQN